MSDEHEETLLICGSEARVPDCMEAECDKCGATVFVAPSGQDIVLEQDAKPVCIPCGWKSMNEQGVPPEPPTPRQLHELESWIRRN